MLKNYIFIFFCVFLVACSAQTPPRFDPLADLIGNVKIATSPTHLVTNARTKSLALIVSTSAETQIKYQEEYANKWRSNTKSFFSSDYDAVNTLLDSVKPRNLIDHVVSELLQRFKNVKVVADLAEFKESGFDIAAVVDLGMELRTDNNPSKLTANTTTDISLILFDKEIRKIGTASGKAPGYGEIIWSYGFSSPPSRDKTLLPIVEAQLNSRSNAFKLFNISLEQLVQK